MVVLTIDVSIGAAAEGVAKAFVTAIVVDQSSPTVIWSMDRYNEHTYMSGCVEVLYSMCQCVFRTQAEMMYMCYLFRVVFSTGNDIRLCLSV